MPGGGRREVVIEYVFLRGERMRQSSMSCVLRVSLRPSLFHFKNPYKMVDHVQSETGLISFNGLIEYKELHTVVTEALVGFAHLYDYVVSKFTLLARLTVRPIHNVKDLECSQPASFNHNHWFNRHVTCFPDYLEQPKPRILSTFG